MVGVVVGSVEGDSIKIKSFFSRILLNRYSCWDRCRCCRGSLNFILQTKLKKHLRSVTVVGLEVGEVVG